MASICAEIATSYGKREPCEIEFAQGVPATLCIRSARFGELSFTDDNLFAAMSACRRRLEQDGYLLLCNGARRDAYPSQMILEMGGRKIYLLHAGRQTSREDLVDIFGAATIEQVCTVAEQRVSYDAWIRSLG
ncbi:hypothetical protein [Ralstonia pseudosolanacearum]|uniref:hypothetical protein n=1 Tax=Ralstonia pseudosolanacearum TaxID=1310165 RepID=UPI001FF715DC|nr:hypothetical protein [Ralstonia pseudosolanacearum]